jgi:epoxyqueuosine reductase
VTNAIPEELRAPMGRHVFGCDICQDVCPWNRNAPVTSLVEFMPRRMALKSDSRNSRSESTNLPDAGGNGDSLYAPPLEWLAALTEEEFRQMFRGSAMKRAKWRGLIRNACVALGNSNLPPSSPAYSRAIGVLERFAQSPDATIAGHARWSIARLKARKASS